MKQMKQHCTNSAIFSPRLAGLWLSSWVKTRPGGTQFLREMYSGITNSTVDEVRVSRFSVIVSSIFIVKVQYKLHVEASFHEPTAISVKMPIPATCLVSRLVLSLLWRGCGWIFPFLVVAWCLVHDIGNWYWPDFAAQGLCLHIMHGDNTADSMLHREVQEIATWLVSALIFWVNILNLPSSSKFFQLLLFHSHHSWITWAFRFFSKSAASWSPPLLRSSDGWYRSIAFETIFTDSVSFLRFDFG